MEKTKQEMYFEELQLNMEHQQVEKGKDVLCEVEKDYMIGRIWIKIK